MSELRESIADLAIEYAICEDMADELESALGWNDEYDPGLHRAIVIVRDESADALGRLTRLVRVLLEEARDE